MEKQKSKFDSDFKELLLERDFEYFLKKHIGLDENKKEDLDILYSSYAHYTKELKKQLKENKKQCLYYLHGQVMLMVNGFLPGFFWLDGSTRSFHITRFEDFGDNWACFDLWQKYERRKRLQKNFWEYITKIGAILAFSLTLIKLWEAFAVKL